MSGLRTERRPRASFFGPVAGVRQTPTPVSGLFLPSRRRDHRALSWLRPAAASLSFPSTRARCVVMPPFLLSILGVFSLAAVYVVGLVASFQAAPLLTAFALVVSVVFIAWLCSGAPVDNTMPD